MCAWRCGHGGSVMSRSLCGVYMAGECAGAGKLGAYPSVLCSLLASSMMIVIDMSSLMC